MNVITCDAVVPEVTLLYQSQKNVKASEIVQRDRVHKIHRLNTCKDYKQMDCPQYELTDVVVLVKTS